MLNNDPIRVSGDDGKTGCVDEVTWLDLDMDKIYQRINACHSFVGGQVLYRRLHYLTEDKERVEADELCFFG